MDQMNGPMDHGARDDTRFPMKQIPRCGKKSVQALAEVGGGEGEGGLRPVHAQSLAVYRYSFDSKLLLLF